MSSCAKGAFEITGRGCQDEGLTMNSDVPELFDLALACEMSTILHTYIDTYITEKRNKTTR